MKIQHRDIHVSKNSAIYHIDLNELPTSMRGAITFTWFTDDGHITYPEGGTLKWFISDDGNSWTTPCDCTSMLLRDHDEILPVQVFPHWDNFPCNRIAIKTNDLVFEGNKLNLHVKVYIG